MFQMKSNIYIVFFFFLSCNYNTNKSSDLLKNSPSSDSLKKNFEKSISFVLTNEKRISFADTKALSYIFFNGSKVRWYGRDENFDIGIFGRTCKKIKEVYGGNLNDVFRKYLFDNNWKIEEIGEDHYGIKECRIKNKVTKGDKMFYYIFVAEDFG
jgi:hypothetical protein